MPAAEHYSGALEAFAASRPVHAAALLNRANVSFDTFAQDLVERIDGLLRNNVTGPELAVTLGAMSKLLGDDPDRFKLAIVEDARAASSQRLANSAPRALWGVTPIVNLASMAEANRRLGIESETICYTAYYITSDFDLLLKKQHDWIIAETPGLAASYYWMVFIWALLRYDIFFYFNDRGLLPQGGYGSDRFGIDVEEMQLLQAAGKRLYTMAYGADNRTRQKTLASGKFNFCMDCPEPGKFCVCDDAEAEQMFSVIDQYATAMLASGLSCDYIPNSYELHYLVLNTDLIEPAPMDHAEVGPLRLLHAPNHGFFKGSAYLEAAVKQLKSEGVPIELELISGKTNTEVLDAMRRSHVVVDQLISGAYGQTAIEAMAIGRPVVCYIKHPERSVAPAELPIVNCNPDTLSETLRALAKMPKAELRAIGGRSRAYVENHHSHEALSRRLTALYLETASLPATVTLKVIPGKNEQLLRFNLNASPTSLNARRAAREGQDKVVEKLFHRLQNSRPGEAAAAERERMFFGPVISNTVDSVHAVGAQILGNVSQALDDKFHAVTGVLNGKLLEDLQKVASGQDALLANTIDAVHAVGARLASEAAERERIRGEELAEFEAKLSEELELLQQAHADAMAAQAAQFDSDRTRLLLSSDILEADRERLRSANAQAHATLANLATSHAALAEKMEERLQQTIAADRRVEAMLASTSWRITKPIRFFGRQCARVVRVLLKPVSLTKRAIRKIGRITKAAGRVIIQIIVFILRLPFRALRASLRVLCRLLDRVAAPMWPRHRGRKFFQKDPTYPKRELPYEKWVSEFTRLNGRPLRVLHIGNIANNAYNNAKIQRQRGIDADVLCSDYYHIMACPEWEDGRFDGKIENDLFPDWWAAKLRGYRRPDWFAQGPLDACVRYLLAHTAKARSKRFLWRWLTFERWMLCRDSERRKRVTDWVFKHTNRIIQHDAGPANGILWKWWAAVLLQWAKKNEVAWPRLAKKMRRSATRLSAFGRTADNGQALIRNLYRTQGQRAATRARLSALLGGPENSPSVDWFFNWWYHPYMKLLMRRYDVVQCYATYTAMPFIIGHDYVAYEHGTIRSIPFQDTDEGKMCMATYRSAKAVFVTNTDNLAAADKMRLPRDRITPLPHAFDSDKLVRFAKRTRVHPPRSDVVFFTPTRQHWVDGDPGWAKGNDRVFHALKLVKDAGQICKVVAIAWGNDVEASRKLVEELGVADMVEWSSKLNKRQLWKAYLRAHAVFDQFVSPALGGVTFEALMLGRRVITAVDVAEMTEFFGDPPPLYNCRTSESIAAAMLKVIADPEDVARDGRKNREWMQRRHSANTIVQLQIDHYKKVLDSREINTQLGSAVLAAKLDLVDS